MEIFIEMNYKFLKILLSPLSGPSHYCY